MKQPAQFELELTTMFKGLKRQLAREKQHGNGKIQTGKSPMPYALYRRINEFFIYWKIQQTLFLQDHFSASLGI